MEAREEKKVKRIKQKKRREIERRALIPGFRSWLKRIGSSWRLLIGRRRSQT